MRTSYVGLVLEERGNPPSPQGPATASYHLMTQLFGAEGERACKTVAPSFYTLGIEHLSGKWYKSIGPYP